MGKRNCQRKKIIAAAAVIFSVCLFLCGCVSSDEWKYDPITDIDNLEGRRVGVNLSWESDYYLDGRKDMEDFNDYLAEFKKTDEYKDLLKRVDSFDGTEYIGADIPLTGTGETIRVSCDPNNFPRTFMEPGDNDHIGYDFEILKHFANDRNYRLEFFDFNYDDGIMGLRSGNYDVMTGYIADVYAEEARNSGLNPSDRMFHFPLHFVQKNQKDIKSDTSVF